MTSELLRHTNGEAVAKAPPFDVSTFRKLLEHTARLAYLNREHLLFVQGQGRDYVNRAGASTFYPSIYRDDMLPRAEVEHRFRELDRASHRLRDLFVKGKIEGHTDLSRKRYVQWSVLQHYEVCSTPLLDFTHSPRVACSFAQGAAANGEAFVYIFGLPYLTNRLSFNSVQDTVIVRLLSICPPSGLRPYFQEGYLAGTTDVTTEYETKSELDFNQRLIAKFRIPSGKRFWGTGLRGLSSDELYPNKDEMKALCEQIAAELQGRSSEGEEGGAALGDFIAAWTGLERVLMSEAQVAQARVFSVREAIRTAERLGVLDAAEAAEADGLRVVRNAVVHGKERVSESDLRQATQRILELRLRVESRRRPRLTSF